MVIWTIQTLKITNHLLAGYSYERIKEKEHAFSHAYDWFSTYCKMPNWPIWCWLNPPTTEELLSIVKDSSEPITILCLNVPNNIKIVFSNFYAWHYALFYNFLDTEHNMLNFDIENKIDHPDVLKNLAQHNEHIKNQVEKSWVKMFDLNWCKKELGSDILQVAIEKIHPIWVQSVKKVNIDQNGLIEFESLKSFEPIV